ncbi:MAG: DUF6513 domain-containing protein, partial [Methylophilaceae bacterium]
TEKILFLTGKLAENSLHRVLESIQPKSFEPQVMNLGVSVAALMTPQMISRRLAQLPDTDKLIVPGLCVGDLEALQQQYGIPVLRGPNDLKDLPQFFGQQGKQSDLSQHNTLIFAEIVDAPFLSVDDIIVRAQHYQRQGADVIDLGCMPNTPFNHLRDSIKALKQLGMR